MAEVLLIEHNVTRAAEWPSLNQPATSSALARLRERFDEELFVAVGRGFRLSSRAKELLSSLQSTLGRVESEIIGGSIASRRMQIGMSD